MSHTDGAITGPFKINFWKGVDAEYPDSPLWADGLNIEVSFSADSTGAQPDVVAKFQQSVDELVAHFESLGWNFGGATAATTGVAFTPTEE